MIMIFMVNQISILIDTLCWWSSPLLPSTLRRSPLSGWHQWLSLVARSWGTPLGSELWPVTTGQGQTRVTSKPRSEGQTKTGKVVNRLWLVIETDLFCLCGPWPLGRRRISILPPPGVSSYPGVPGLTSLLSSPQGSDTDISDWRYN